MNTLNFSVKEWADFYEVADNMSKKYARRGFDYDELMNATFDRLAKYGWRFDKTKSGIKTFAYMIFNQGMIRLYERSKNTITTPLERQTEDGEWYNVEEQSTIDDPRIQLLDSEKSKRINSFTNKIRSSPYGKLFESLEKTGWNASEVAKETGYTKQMVSLRRKEMKKALQKEYEETY